jgi:hypothetical protein
MRVLTGGLKIGNINSFKKQGKNRRNKNLQGQCQWYQMADL